MPMTLDAMCARRRNELTGNPVVGRLQSDLEWRRGLPAQDLADSSVIAVAPAHALRLVRQVDLVNSLTRNPGHLCTCPAGHTRCAIGPRTFPGGSPLENIDKAVRRRVFPSHSPFRARPDGHRSP